MTRYALLILPAANRVYAQASVRLTRAELEVKERYQAGDTQDLEVVNADATRALEFFRRGRFDVLVADLPYGVQHGSTVGSGLRRGPAELLATAMPVWAELLRPGGAVGVSWNTHVARRDQLITVMASNGLQVLDGDAYLQFQHRVDQAIVRDLLVARKPLMTS